MKINLLLRKLLRTNFKRDTRLLYVLLFYNGAFGGAVYFPCNKTKQIINREDEELFSVCYLEIITDKITLSIFRESKDGSLSDETNFTKDARGYRIKQKGPNV